MRLQRRFAHDRRRRVDRLYAFRVRQRLQPQRRHRAIGAVGHRRIDAGGLLRRRLDGHRRVAAGQGQQLILIQFEAVGVLERRQRIRPFDKFRRGRQLELAAAVDPLAEIRQRFEMVGVRHVLTNGDGPGVVGRRGVQPDDFVFVVVELLHLLEAGLGVLPRRIFLIGEEKCAVAGVFRVDVDLAGGDGAAQHLGGAELQLVGGFNAVGFQYLHDDVAEQRTFGIDLGADAHRVGRLRQTAGGQQSQRDGKGTSA